jgi:hypothetical protein
VYSTHSRHPGGPRRCSMARKVRRGYLLAGNMTTRRWEASSGIRPAQADRCSIGQGNSSASHGPRGEGEELLYNKSDSTTPPRNRRCTICSWSCGYTRGCDSGACHGKLERRTVQEKDSKLPGMKKSEGAALTARMANYKCTMT